MQKSTVLSKLVEIFPCSGGPVKLPPETNVSAFKDNFGDPREKVKSLPIQASDHISIPEIPVFPGMVPQFHILLSS